MLAAALGLAACTTASPAPDPTPAVASTQAPTATPGPPAASSPTPAATSPASRSASGPTIAEPTTTNTLPPPPEPSRPAPSTAGRLTSRDLPVPAGWRSVVRAGGSEEDFQGNGTWVHARDPRYAAFGVITLGCAEVTRDDYPDPTAALEGTYQKKKDQPGIGLVLQFASERQAAAYYRVYLRQIRACRTPDGPVVVEVVPSALGLIDRRSSADGDWTEVGRLSGSRLTLVILSDPGHRRSRADSEALLRDIAG